MYLFTIHIHLHLCIHLNNQSLQNISSTINLFKVSKRNHVHHLYHRDCIRKGMKKAISNDNNNEWKEIPNTLIRSFMHTYIYRHYKNEKHWKIVPFYTNTQPVNGNKIVNLLGGSYLFSFCHREEIYFYLLYKRWLRELKYEAE